MNLKIHSSSLLVFILLTNCSKVPHNKYSTINVEIKNSSLIDSLVIYDKTESWKIISSIKPNIQGLYCDTLNISETKLYQLYLFNEQETRSFSEIMLSKNSDVNFNINAENPFESLTYSGTNNNINNFIAYQSNLQHQLSELLKENLPNKKLEEKTNTYELLINKKAKELNIPDSLKQQQSIEYNSFKRILLKKNTKYLYKTSLIGKKGNNFTVKDKNGHPVNLKSYIGNYIYIDVWATWCKPCKVEYPYLKAIESKFEEQKNLKIISVSIDKDISKWQNYIKKKEIKGVQLYTGNDSKFVQFYDIGAIPRFILIDPEGTVINADDIRPSNKEIHNYLTTKINSVVND